VDEFGERPIRGRAREEYKAFVALIRRSTPHVWVTYALIAVNVAAFLARTWVVGISPKRADFIAFGANYGPRTSGGEWWRLIASGLQHVGVEHLLVNVVWLYWVGRILECLYGNVAFLAVFLLSVLGGSVASLVVHPDVTSLGASGGLFGAFGALLLFLKWNEGVVPRRVAYNLTSVSLLLVVLTLVQGGFTPGIDNAAHVGGFVTGIVAGACLMRSLPPQPGRRWLRAARAVALGGGLFALAVIVG